MSDGSTVGGRRRGPWPRALRILCALVFASLSLVLVVQAPSYAAPGITLNKSAPADVLVGGSVDYTLAAANPGSNPDAVPEYNVTFRDVLPVGVTYDGGSTTPAGYGEPQVITDPDTGQQTLIWSNVADLAPGSSTTLSFNATLSAAAYPVGTDAVNNADVYTNSNPRRVPKFTGSGEPIPTSFTETASDLASTRVSAISLQKSEPSPEGELLRGVHDHTTVYTLTVTNNHGADTTGAGVVDLIPAGLEFLGCGRVDNTTTGPEYPTAPSLTGTPPVASCPTPDSVSTVSNPPGVPAGVYTRVVWSLGDLAPDEVVTIRYAAGIPQRANTTTWAGPTPTPGSLGQSANLDNNVGPSTRETATELSLTNHASVEGDYTGPVAPGSGLHVSASDTETVTAEDVRLLKSSDTGTFVEGGVQGYTLTIDTSEYVDASQIVVTDHLPNGLCPLDDVDNYVAGTPADCDPSAAFAPQNATITGVVQHPDGSFDVTFSPLTLDADGTTRIHYDARMRTTYTGGGNAGDPTSSGDSFTNTAHLTATTVPAPGVDPPPPTGPETVGDESSATLVADAPSLQKSILPQATPMACGTTGDGYVHDPTPAQDTFSEGDRVCFKIRVQFPADVATRNPAVRDFLPPNVTYEAGSAQATDANTTPFSVDDSTGDPLFTIGDTRTKPTFRFVPPGATFEVVLSGIVETPGAGPAPDVTANLAKFIYATSTGTVSQRDAVGLRIAAPPPVLLVKGVSDVNGGPVNPPNTDNVQVRAGDTVTFGLDLHNDGSAADDNAVDVLSPDVWDVLPLGIACTDISAISDGGACTDPGDAGQPSFSGSGTHSAIRWQLAASPTLAPGDSRTLTYAMTIPADTSVNTSFPNTASVRSYDTATNRPGVTAEHLPHNNVDTSTDPLEWDVPRASDDSEVHTPSVSLAKSNLTDITEQNNGPNQAVVGETLTYTVQLRVPAHTSVFHGVLSDPMPTGITYLSSSATFSASNTSPATDPLPPGFSLDPANGTLSFPPGYTNNDDNPQLFEVRIRARVSTLATNGQGVQRVNTARFNSRSALGLGTDLPEVTARSTVTVVAPQITLTKTDDDPDNFVEGGQQVTYTLRVVGTNGRPPAHDLWVVDCVPNGLAFNAFLDPHPGTATTVAGDGTNGCAAGATRIAWNLPDSSTTAQLLRYTVTVSPLAVGGQQYTNTATARGSSLNDGKTDPLAPDNPLERVVTSSDSDTLTVRSGVITKIADPDHLTIGERGTWSIQVLVNPNVNFFNAAIIDQLPAGIVAASVRLESVECEFATGDTCTTDPTPLTPAAGPGTGTTIGWLFGDVLAAPTARTVTITYSAVVADLPSVHRGDVVTNTAFAAWDLTQVIPPPTSVSDPFDRKSANASANVTILEPVLSIDKTVTPTTPAPGQTFGYSIDVAALSGPNTSDAFNTTLVDTIPTGVVVDPDSISNGGALTDTRPEGGGTITWTIPGPLSPGAVTSVSYRATLAASSTLTSAPLTNTAQVTHYESLDSGGRSYVGPSDTATIQPAFPHISLAKRASPGPAYIGESKSFTLTIASDGDATAHDIAGTDTLPPNWTYDPGSAMVTVAGGPAVQVEPDVVTDGNVQTLSLPTLFDLPVGQNVVITYSATPQPAVVTDPGVGATVPHTNTLQVHAADLTGATSNADGPYADPPVSASVFISSADVSVAKTHTGNAVPGQPLAWSVVVTNHGADTATGPFRVVDDLPSGIASATASGPGWSCSGSLTQIVCTRPDAGDTLAAGASFPPITVTTGIPADTDEGTTFTNHASVTAHTHDPDLTNNQDTDTATARRSVDLALTKTGSGPFVAGQDATYLLTVQNRGPSNTVGPIVVTDTVPAGTSYVSAAGPGWTCDETGGQITCTRATALAAGDSAPHITLMVHVASDRVDPVTNTARVDGPSPDPVPGNNSDTVTRSPGEEADLAIEKSSPGDFVPGDQGTYRFRIHNFGPSYAEPTVQVTDTLPASLTYAGFTSVTPGWTCSAAGQDVTCSLAGRFADGASATVEIQVDIDPDQVGDIVNTAHVSSPTPDPNPANNTDDDHTASLVNVDLAIAKSHTGNATAGQPITYTLATRNNGPSSAAGPIVVHDALPAGMTFVSATGTGWVCTGSERIATCTRAAGLAAGSAAPDITLVADVAPDAGPATLTNIASINGPDTDINLDNNTAHDPTVVGDQANISLTKTTTGDNPVSAGDTTAFTIVVHNDGPSDADAVTVTDQLPAGLSLVSVDGDGWTCTRNVTIQCVRDTVASGADAPPIVVTVRVASGVPDGTTITNTADSSTSTPGDDPADNTDDAIVDVLAAADLTLHKTHPRGVVHAGDQVTFDLAVSNDGPSDALAPISVVDQLPVGMTYTSSAGTWSCDADAPDASGQRVTCVLNGNDSLLAGTDAPPLHLTVQTDAALDPGTLTNSAAVDSPTTDPVPGNNTDTDDVDIDTSADLRVVKSHDPAARVGDPLTFTLAVTNDGPSAARQVEVSDELPAGLTFVSADGDGWTCAEDAHVVTCDLTGPLAAGADAPPISLVVTVEPSAYPGVDNIATVDSATPDTDPSDNSSTDHVTVPPLVDLAIGKSHRDPISVGHQATYRLRVVNHGPTPDPGPVRVTDALPGGLTFVSATGDGWACTEVTGTVSCVDADGLQVGEHSTIRLVVTVEASAYPSVVNVASVTSDAEDTDPDNNTATDPATVLPSVELTVDKRLLSLTRSTATYRITVGNRGPNDTATPIVVVDDLPSVLSYVTASGPGWTCQAASTTVTCTHPATLRVGRTTSFVLTAAVAAGATGEVVNHVVVTGGHTGRDPSDVAVGSLPPIDQPPSPTGPGLPNTGGPALAWLVAALVCLTAGGVLLASSRRRS